MNKKLIALAVVAGVAMPMAGAHAGATVFGAVQQEIVSVDSDAANTTTGDGLHMVDGMTGNSGTSNEGSGASAFGVKVSEDIGGRMKAIAKITFNFDADAGGGVTQRDSFVGLAGAFGTVTMGRFNTPSKAINAKWDPFLATFMQARTNGGMSSAYNGYGMSNAIGYTNKFGPVKLIAAMGLDETNDDATTDTDGDHQTDIAISVPAGPVTIVVSALDTAAQNAGDTGKTSTVKAGVKWASGPMSAVVQMEDTENKGVVGADTEGQFIYANFGYKMGKNLMTVAYGSFEGDTAGSTNNDASYIAVGMIHSLSKRTRVHVGYRSTEGDAASGSTSAIDSDMFGVGLRVSF